MRATLLFLYSLLTIGYSYKSYTGYKVVQIVPNGKAQVTLVRNMESEVGSEVNYWTEAGSVSKGYIFSVAPTLFPAVAEYLTSKRIDYTILTNDLSKSVQRSYLEVKNTPSWDRKSLETFDLSKYHSYNEQMAFVRAISEAYPENTEIGVIGKSYENREILYLKLGYPTGASKKTFLIDGGFHAREWISSATALYFIEQLAVDQKYQDLLREIDIVIIPNVNPDGYEYSRNHDRLWRKTRSGPLKGCYGVDLNRNFPFKWGYVGSSNYTCSLVYRGQEPLSEVESSNLAKFFEANKDSINAYVTLHSYGENIIYPWGYKTQTYPDDVHDLKAMGLAAAEAIQDTFGTIYKVGGSADDLYPASGSSDDYAKSIGVKFVYTFELKPSIRGTPNIGYYGFQLPSKYILPAAKEASAGLIVMAERIASNNV